MADYQTTDVPYAGMSQTDIREPVLRGVGHAPLGPAADTYRSVAEQLRRVGDSVAGALKAATAAHAGQAADAAERHIASMIEPGDVGWAQAELAARALEDAADHHIRARQDMQAFPEPDFFTPGSERDRLHTSTVIAGQRYQDNVNHGLSTTFQAFPPPVAGEIGVQPASVIPGSTGAGSAGGMGASGAPGSVGGAALPGGGPGGAGTIVPPAPGTAAGQSAGRKSAPLRSGPGQGGSAPSPTGAGRSGVPDVTGTAPQSLPRAPVGSPPSRWPADPPGSVLGGPVSPPTTDPVISGGVADGRWGSEQRGGSTWPGGNGAGAGWSGSSNGSGAGGRSSGFADPEPRSRPGEPAASNRPAAPSRPAGQPGYGGMPMMGAGAGAGQEREHRRPPWLLEPDPEALWMGNLPPHTDPVIEPYGQDR